NAVVMNNESMESVAEMDILQRQMQRMITISFSEPSRDIISTSDTRQSSPAQSGLTETPTSKIVENAITEFNGKVQKRLERLYMETGLPLLKRRKHVDKEHFMDPDSESEEIILENGLEILYEASANFKSKHPTGLYGVEDLYEAVRNMNVSNTANTPPSSQTIPGFWCQPPLPVPSMSVEEFRNVFEKLHPRYQHMGLDDLPENPECEAYTTKHAEIGERVLKSMSIDDIREYAKRGLPPYLRPEIWQALTNPDFTIDAKSNYQPHCTYLKSQVASYDLMIDHLITSDVRKSQDDDTYFVFEDMVLSTLLLFSRDPWVKEHCPSTNPQLTTTVDSLKNMRGRFSLPITTYPPSSVLPFSGLSSYAMLTSFLHSDLNNAYITFRNLYVRYFHSLHTLHPTTGLPSLCATFESFLKQLDPLIPFHLNSISVDPLKFATEWMVTGFVWVLDVEQVMALWDRVLGFGRLEILPAVAACLFLFRREMLLSSRGVGDLEKVFADMKVVPIIPLLQHYFFVFNTDKDEIGRQWKGTSSAGVVDYDEDEDY
ncbi:hypothetical protein HDV05_008787, partial [Chytridiales sp. JEL 0842]